MTDELLVEAFSSLPCANLQLIPTLSNPTTHELLVEAVIFYKQAVSYKETVPTQFFDV